MFFELSCASSTVFLCALGFPQRNFPCGVFHMVIPCEVFFYVSYFIVFCVFPQQLDPPPYMRLKNRYPKWHPGKWKQQPALVKYVFGAAAMCLNGFASSTRRSASWGAQSLFWRAGSGPPLPTSCERFAVSGSSGGVAQVQVRPLGSI